MKKFLFLFCLLFSSNILTNTVNSFGTVGVNYSPTSRFLDEGSLALVISHNENLNRFDILAQPYEWLEFSLFYADLVNLGYAASLGQSYKDKGFNTKIRLSKETKVMPQIAVGLSDFAGTGLFSGEYLVASKRYGSFDFSLGMGWGIYNGGLNLKNPLIELNKEFKNRNYINDGATIGEFDIDDYFTGEDAGIFSSVVYAYGNHNFILDLSSINFEDRFGITDKFSSKFLGYTFKSESLEASIFIGDKNDINLSMSTNTNFSLVQNKKYNYVESKHDIKILNLVDKLQANNIALKNLYTKNNSLFIGIRQNSYQNVKQSVLFSLESLKESNIDDYEEVTVVNYSFGSPISSHKAFFDNGVIKRTNFEKIDDEYQLLDIKEEFPKTTFNLSPSLRSFVASREQFLVGGLLLLGDLKTYFSESTYLDVGLTYSVADNFDILFLDPVTTFPAQVRSDIKDYLNGMSNGIAIQRFEINHLRKNKNNYLSFKAGILEQMFSGFGFEYLKLDQFDNMAFGFEAYQVKKRGYDLNFDHLDYETFTGHINFFHYYDPLKLTTHISFGRYLAGDDGVTIDFSKGLVTVSSLVHLLHSLMYHLKSLVKALLIKGFI